MIKNLRFSLFACNGTKRATYEDNFLCDQIIYSEQPLPLQIFGIKTENRQFYAVFDGFGEDGKKAAMLAADTLKKYQSLLISDQRKEIDPYMIMCLMEANKKICESTTEQSKTGTSAAIFCTDNNKGYVYNIGDSRVYLVRNKKLYLLSEDHTEANRLYKLGAVDYIQYRELNKKRRLTQYLGVPAEDFVIKPYKTAFKLKKEDKILLCTNGITRILDENDIRALLADEYEYKSAELFKAIQTRNARDDCTAVLCELKNL